MQFANCLACYIEPVCLQLLLIMPLYLAYHQSSGCNIAILIAVAILAPSIYWLKVNIPTGAWTTWTILLGIKYFATFIVVINQYQYCGTAFTKQTILS